MRLVVLPLFFIAAPAFAETDIRQLVIDTALANNCQLTDAIAEATFPALGLTKEDVGPVVEEMRAAGEAEVVGDALTLSPELCGGEAVAAAPEVPEVSPTMAQVIAVFQEHGCTMTEEEGEPALAAAGISEEATDALGEEADALVEAGFMLMDEETMAITFTEPLCAGGPVREAAADPAEPLIRMLSENGCSLTQEAAGALMGDYGVTTLDLDEMADSLMDRGLARVEGEALVLEGCGG